ncbi:SDR family oxidoreductase [Bradyrhizobium sp. F1.13.3]|uniref:SDR family NAD(P)-dependent oxidoreductase n=1 Tax=Bradyrhizobium sp. F1.13.3 TaxID=3156351 RepID=UPI0033988F26
MTSALETAVVTGASSGIGSAYAEDLARRGYGIVLVARRQDRLAALAEKLRSNGAKQVDVLAADLAASSGLRKVEALLALRDDITLLVNSAGLGALGPTAQTGPEEAERLVLVNVLALTRLSIAALQRFRSRNKGTLINIASVIALGPSPTAAAYSGSKAYVLNFSRSLEQEYAESAITVQTILPGPVHSEFFAISGVTKPGMPEHLFMTPEQLVATAMKALELKEAVCFPTLRDTALWNEFEGARKKFYKAVISTGEPAARYKS